MPIICKEHGCKKQPAYNNEGEISRDLAHRTIVFIRFNLDSYFKATKKYYLVGVSTEMAYVV